MKSQHTKNVHKFAVNGPTFGEEGPQTQSPLGHKAPDMEKGSTP